MKTALIGLTVLLATPALAQAPRGEKPRPTCLRASQITSSVPAKDEKSILFTMQNGDKWRGDFNGTCFGIRAAGFEWELKSDNQVCANLQTLRVLQGGTSCALGSLTQLPRNASKN